MKRLFLLPLMMAAFIGTPAFADNDSVNKADSAQMQTTKDGEIIAMLIALDSHEITAAKMALKKSTMPAVKDYAAMINHDHSQNLIDVLAISKEIGANPGETEAVLLFNQKGAKGIDTLSSLNGKAFDKAYIDAMVEGHQHALLLIDDNFLKNVSNPALKKLVLQTRPHILHHLEKAQDIQKTLQ